MISVIIPAYNCAPCIEKAVLSVVESASLKMSEFEVIIVNDGSTDDTSSICQRLQRKYSENIIRIITQENGGCMYARLTGFKNARGNYCTTVDADDYVSSDYIDGLTALMQEKEDYDYLLLNDFLNTSGTDKFHLERDSKRDIELSDKEQLIKYVLTKGEGAIWNKVFKTSIMRKLSMEVPKEKCITYGEDLLLNLLYLSREEVRRTYISSVACYYHYVDSMVSVCGNLKVEKALFDHIRLNLEFERILNQEVCVRDEKLLSHIMLNRIRCISKYVRELQKLDRVIEEQVADNVRVIRQNMKKYRPASVRQLAYKIDFLLMSLTLCVR